MRWTPTTWRPPNAPALLTILCFRSEETASKPFLQALLERRGSEECVTLSLGPMEDESKLTFLPKRRWEAQNEDTDRFGGSLLLVAVGALLAQAPAAQGPSLYKRLVAEFRLGRVNE